MFYWLTTLSTNFWWMEKSLVASYLNTHHTCSSSWNQCKFFNTRWKISLIIATIWSVIYTHRERSIFLSIIHLSICVSIYLSVNLIYLSFYLSMKAKLRSWQNISEIYCFTSLSPSEIKTEILAKHFWDTALQIEAKVSPWEVDISRIKSPEKLFVSTCGHNVF